MLTLAGNSTTKNANNKLVNIRTDSFILDIISHQGMNHLDTKVDFKFALKKKCFKII